MDSQTLIAIVKEAIASKLEKRDFDYGKYEDTSGLHEDKASFVTLHNPDNSLRGCIGSLEATQPLLQDLIKNARAAAFSDPRFMPITGEEFEDISFEISILTKPVLLQYGDYSDLKEKIIPFTHGVIIKHTYHQATFLPSVWEQLPHFDDFFAHLCSKAGMEQNCLHHHPEIFVYEAKKYRS